MLDKETGEAKAKLSEAKLKIASSVLQSKRAFELFEVSAIKLVNYDQIDYNFLDRKSSYENGIIKITKRGIISCSLDKFDSLFKILIERNIKKK